MSEFLKWSITDSEALNLICERDGRLAGYGFGAPQGYNIRMNSRTGRDDCAGDDHHPGLFVRSGFLAQLPERLRHLAGRSNQASLPTPDEQQKRIFRMVGLGVSPDFRPQGIGQQLIRAYEEEMWARALYEVCGWKPLKSSGKVVTYRTERSALCIIRKESGDG